MVSALRLEVEWLAAEVHQRGRDVPGARPSVRRQSSRAAPLQVRRRPTRAADKSRNGLSANDCYISCRN